MTLVNSRAISHLRETMSSDQQQKMHLKCMFFCWYSFTQMWMYYLLDNYVNEINLQSNIDANYVFVW